VLRPASGCGKHLQHVPQRLFKLRHKLFRIEFLARIPADLPSEKYDLAWCGFDAIGISNRLRPTFRE
jgi:hypothetical protein